MWREPATHSTWCVIGKMSASAGSGKLQVRGHFAARCTACGRPERQTSVMADNPSLPMERQVRLPRLVHGGSPNWPGRPGHGTAQHRPRKWPGAAPFPSSSPLPRRGRLCPAMQMALFGLAGDGGPGVMLING